MAEINYLDLRVEQFLDVITNKKTIYQISFPEVDTHFQGTLSEITSLISQLKESETKNEIQDFFRDKTEYAIDFELSDIEVYNYLEKHTSNFDRYKTKILLRDIEVYYYMDFKERIQEESRNIYDKKNWEIPIKEILSPFNEGELINIADQNAMIKKTHPFDDFTISRVIHLLKEKLSDPKEKKDTPNTAENPHPRYFVSEKAYRIFNELQETVRERYKLADYSFIYRQMWKDEYIYEGIKEKEFRDFLMKEYKIELPEPLKTLDNCSTDLKFNSYSKIISSK